MDEYLSKKIKIISFISIIMVVYLHAFNLKTKINTLQDVDLNSYVQQFLSNGVTRIAVPLFFLISGYLFFVNFTPTFNNFISKYKKRFFSLVIPFLFWSIYGLILYFVMQSIPVAKNFFTGELIKNYSFSKIINTIFVNPIPYQLWFLIDLIKYIAISPIIYWYISKCSYYSVIPFSFFWFFNINIVFVNSEGILFFIIGSMMAIKQINLNNIKAKNKYKALIIFLIWIAILLFKTYFGLINIYIANYILKFSIIIGILAVWSIYDICTNNSTDKTKLLQLTDFTFIIFASHEPILTIIKKAMIKVLGDSSYSNLIVYLVSPILTIAFVMGIALFLRKYFNRLYSIITGGRSGKQY